MRARFIIIPILVILTSLYLFPISFFFFPEGVNTKMLVAVLGILAFVWDCVRRGAVSISRQVLISALLAVVFSIWCLFSISVNQGGDTTYSRYWLSFATWLGGAYAVCFCIREMTGEVNLRNLTSVLAAVCVLQCILALVIHNSAPFRQWVDSVVLQDQDFYQEVNRWYGIGAALDTAGVRFSVVLVLIAHQLSRYGKALESTAQSLFFFVAFAVIVLMGSIIARTTWVGGIAGILYMALSNIHIRQGVVEGKQLFFWSLLLGTVILTVSVSAYLYFNNPDFRQNLRFGFEGFFNWAETGVFRTDSTDKLNRIMWVWPQDTRSWIIGTGLFDDWVYGTDIGYCRFTLYCGLVGMVLFSIFFVYNGIAINEQLEHVGFLSLFLIALTFIIWVKVSTDIFFIYALLFCLNAGKNQPVELCTSSIT